MKFSVSDCYNQTDTENKLNAVKEVLNLSSSNTNSNCYHFSFTSIAAGITAPVSTYVGEMNWNTSQFILNEFSGPAGYVYGDYMGSSEKSGSVIVSAVIKQNFKYCYEGRKK